MVITAQGARLGAGYKETEIGIVPKDWRVEKVKHLAAISTGSRNTQDRVEDGAYPFFVRSQTIERVNSYSFDGEAVLTAGDGVGTGKVFHYINGRFDFHQRVYKISDFSESLDGYYFYLYFSQHFYARIMSMTAKSSVDSVRMDMIADMLIPLPPLSEQRAIAAALSDVDALTMSFDRLIAKKRDIKQGAMQQLLTGMTRLPGFTGEWGFKVLGDVTNCLDHLRIPLNEAQRQNMQGDYPYCGANGILDYVNDFLIDDDIILLAEDGGNFSEYASRPIAYKMSGKCWVNNHAHILQAKEDVDQDFIFYSLVQKNILRFLAVGTRAKLNKAEMYKIEIDMPQSLEEQCAIATVLSDMDGEIAALERQLDKTHALKQGMMQELLTGRTRLV